MTFFEKVFGSQLLTQAGKKATKDVLAGKSHVLCYFSAHWCPPCRRFTPEFASVYTKTHAAKSYEVVFVSLDRDEGQYNEYFGTMPWTAIPYDSKERTGTAKKYGGKGIPELLVFSAEGDVVSRDGVQKVTEDPQLNGFPWPPPTWEDALGKTLIKKDGTAVSTDTLKGKTVGIYCSAHWCPPCRQFTPMLAKFYAEYKAKDPNFEIVFCSSDRDKATMMSYFKEDHGDYLCYDYDAPSREVMRQMVNAEGIPTFAIYSPEGKLVNKAGRNKVSEGVAAVLKSGWEPPLVGDFGTGGLDCQGTDIQETPSIVVFCQGCDDDEQADIAKALEAFSRETKTGDAPELITYISKSAGGIGAQVLGLAKKNGSSRVKSLDDEALMILYDLPSGKFYESKETDITVENLKKFAADYAGDKLDAKGLAQ